MKRSTLRFVSKYGLKFFMKRIFQLSCSHRNRKVIWRDYNDRYIEEQCTTCKKRLYTDL